MTNINFSVAISEIITIVFIKYLKTGKKIFQHGMGQLPNKENCNRTSL